MVIIAPWYNKVKMERKITFENEKDLVYGFKCEGSYAPVYSYCKVYNDGTVKYGKGSFCGEREEKNGTMKIPEKSIEAIEKLINDNVEVFMFKDDDFVNRIVPTDDATDTYYFVSEKRRNEIAIYASPYTDDEDEYEYDDDCFMMPDPHKDAIMKRLIRGIHGILRKCGIDREYC